MGLFVSVVDPSTPTTAVHAAATVRALAALCAIVRHVPAEAEPAVRSALMLNGSWLSAAIDPSAEDQQQHCILQGPAVYPHSPMMTLALDPGFLSVTDGVADHIKSSLAPYAHVLSPAPHPKPRDAPHFAHRLELSALRATKLAIPDAGAGQGVAPPPHPDAASASEMLLPRSVLRWLEGGGKRAQQWVELRTPTAVLVAHVSHRGGMDVALPVARCVHTCLAKESGWVHLLLAEPSHTLVVGCFEGDGEAALKVPGAYERHRHTRPYHPRRHHMAPRSPLLQSIIAMPVARLSSAAKLVMPLDPCNA